MGIVKFMAVAALLAVILTSCKKKDEVNPVEGKIVLAVKVTHHDVPVASLPVFLKWNSSSYPGPDSTKYEYRQMTNSNGEVFFTKQVPGTHYLYSAGNDAGEQVIGYQPVNINSSTISNDTVKVSMYVSH